MILISMISPGALRLPDVQQNISCSWWVLQGWTVKSSTAVFHGMFGLEMPRRLSSKAVNQTAKGSCHCSCQHLGIHWLTGHHFGKMLFTGWLAIYMVCRTHLTSGQRKSLVDSPVSTTWGMISTGCCFWSMTTATKSWVSLSAMWTISMASTGRTMTLVRSIRNSSGASCSFSRLTSLRLSKELCYKLNKENRVVLHITMKKFLETVEPYELPRGRMKQPEVLTPDEQKEFRSIAGCLQWLGSQTRPDVSPAISLCNHGQQTTIHDLKALAETLQHAKNTQELGLVIQDVPVNKESVLMTYTDASWANAAHSTSQMGILVALTTPDVTSKITKGALLDWRSARSPRVCRSTLASEASAADEGSDRSAYLNMMLSEILFCEPAHRAGCRLDNLQATDAKSLYDALLAVNSTLTDKRSLVNIRAIQETLSPKQTRWIPTHLMHADGLTKMNPILRDNLLRWLQFPTIQVIESPKVQKEKDEWQFRSTDCMAGWTFDDAFHHGIWSKGSSSLISFVCWKRPRPLCSLAMCHWACSSVFTGFDKSNTSGCRCLWREN